MDTERGKKRCMEGVDVISNIGCSVIKNILKYVPLRDAVRTSILSRAWRYKWSSIPNLICDRDFVLESCLSSRARGSIQSVIYHILLLHQGTIDKFKLDISMIERLPLPDMKVWIRHLSHCDIQDFTLCLHPSGEYIIPSDLFTFEKLSCSTLSGCNFKLPREFKEGFPLLSLLDLEKVHFVDPDELCCFISNCPLLGHLRLENCTPFEALNIDVPNLKTFHFCSEFKSIKLKSATLLAEILLHWASSSSLPFDVAENESNLIGFLGHLSSLTILDLNCSALHFLSMGGVPEKLPEDLNHMKVLRVCIDFNVIPQISAVVCLFKSFPNLEILEISSSDGADDVEPAALQFLQEMCRISLNQLKQVKISNFLCLEPEIAFVKLLVAAATTLQKLEICSLCPSASERGSQFTRICPASPKPEIIFHV